MISFPNAKINLGLNVTGRREDGFHDIKTAMLPVRFHDILEILPVDGEEDMLSLSGLDVPGRKEDNLCLKACRLYREGTGAGRVLMHLHKVIPPGSGLGGGSSDASHALRMINTLFENRYPEKELMELSARLGSDCPFFMSNKPALASGRGEVLTNMEVDLRNMEILILLPEIHVSTSWAYSQVTPRDPEVSIEEVFRSGVSEWKGSLINDFEKPVFEKFPVLKDLRDRLYKSGAAYAAMSGSGSAIFGIFEKIPVSIDSAFPGIRIIKTSLFT